MSLRRLRSDDEWSLPVREDTNALVQEEAAYESAREDTLNESADCGLR
jgi:hypothetical protein